MITECEKIEALYATADTLEEAAAALSDTVTRLTSQVALLKSEELTLEDVGYAKELVNDEIVRLRSLAHTLRHQEDVRETMQLSIASLAHERRNARRLSSDSPLI